MIFTVASTPTAAKAAQAYNFIMELPNGYDTIVGERSVKYYQTSGYFVFPQAPFTVQGTLSVNF